MEWCTDVLAVYLPNISGAHFKQVVCELLFLEEPEVPLPLLSDLSFPPHCPVDCPSVYTLRNESFPSPHLVQLGR
jgi:hypothetical protein